MTAEDFLGAATRWLFVAIFVVVAQRALRRRRRCEIDSALLFGAVSLFVGLDFVSHVLRVTDMPPLHALRISLVVALPYLLLRLVSDFSDPPRWLLWGAGTFTAGFVVMAIALPEPWPVWFRLLPVPWFLAVGGYATVSFLHEARRSMGVTSRRMYAVAAGSALLVLTIVVGLAPIAVPGIAPWSRVTTAGFSLLTGVAYFCGFAPPALLRRAWQEPELRAFLRRAAELPRMRNARAIVRELERGAAESTGTSSASIGLWDEERQVLQFRSRDGVFELRPGEMIAGRSFVEQRAIFCPNAPREDTDNANLYQAYGATAVLAAPITAGEDRLGVLVVYAPRAPIFADEDLVLVELLAQQAAAVLETHALSDEAAQLRAREEATRLKDDFLSAAAHDLKTPLTTLLAQAELLERQAIRNDRPTVEIERARTLIRETKRLKGLVLDLLEASRVEYGRLVVNREVVDLVEVAKEACERYSLEDTSCSVEGDAPVVGMYDRKRVAQLVDNLIENGMKYAPDRRVFLRVWRQGDEARLSVTDEGIGISADDLPHVFDRFYRGRNVDDRKFAGMGLGLFICRGIAEQHGGRIWVESQLGVGSTFHVELPCLRAAPNLVPVAEPSSRVGDEVMQHA